MGNKYAKLLKNREKQKGLLLDMKCVECGEKVYTGYMKHWDETKHDKRYGGSDTYFYCDNEDCLNKERLITPKQYSTCVILEDEINYVMVKYQYGCGNSQITNKIRCHWSTKGRFIIIKGKRVYL